jgi:hypothetical protein
MNNRILLSTSILALTSVLLALNAEAATVISVPGLYNTGVNASGAVLPLQSLEQHYSVSGASSIAYVEPPVYEPNLGWAWLPAPAGSAWIGPNSTTNTASPDPEGIYHYTLNFNLTGYNPADVRISGSWMTDNTGELYLNGVFTGFTTDPESYKHPTAFNLASGFVSGVNTLEFRVLNEFVGPNPSGLCVSGLSATLVPEPTSAVLIIVGSLATMVPWKQRRRV